MRDTRIGRWTSAEGVIVHSWWYRSCSTSLVPPRVPSDNAIIPPVVSVTDRRRRQSGFTLVEVMIVVAVIALLAALAVPAFIRARKRSQASHVLNELRLIDDAVAQYAIETARKPGDDVYVDDWIAYLKPGTRLYKTGQDVLGNDFDDQKVDQNASVPQDTWDALADAVPASFWQARQRKNGRGPKHKNR